MSMLPGVAPTALSGFGYIRLKRRQAREPLCNSSGDQTNGDDLVWLDCDLETMWTIRGDRLLIAFDRVSESDPVYREQRHVDCDGARSASEIDQPHNGSVAVFGR